MLYITSIKQKINKNTNYILILVKIVRFNYFFLPFFNHYPNICLYIFQNPFFSFFLCNLFLETYWFIAHSLQKNLINLNYLTFNLVLDSLTKVLFFEKIYSKIDFVN
jgi:hypothetical protein